MATKKPQLKTFRLEKEVEDMLLEMCSDTMRSQNNMVAFCIKEYYSKIFKKP